MKSAYEERFLLRLAEAVRTGWSCLLAATLLLYAKPIQTFISAPILAPVLAILLTGPPLGTVLCNSVGILSVSLPALLSTMVVLHLLEPPLSTFAAIVCTGVSSFFIAYLSETHILGRKMALAQVGIVYISAHYDADMSVVYFPLKMVPAVLLGVVVGILATLFPIPRLAVWEVPGSARTAARVASEVYKTLLKAFSAVDESTFAAMHLHSKVLAKASTESVTKLKGIQVDIWWELGACGSRHAHKRLTKGVEVLNLHLTGMDMALQSGLRHTPDSLRSTLKGTLMRIADQCKSLLETGVQVQLKSSTMHRGLEQKLIDDGKEILALFDENLLSARKQAFYSSELDDVDAAEFWKDHRDSTSPDLVRVAHIKHKFRGRVSSLFFLFNFKLYFMEAMNLVSPGYNVASGMYQIAKIGHPVTGLEAKIHTTESKGQSGTIYDKSPVDSTRLIPPVFLAPDDPSLEGRRLSSGRFKRNSSLGQSKDGSTSIIDDRMPPTSSPANHDADQVGSDTLSSSRETPSFLPRQCSHCNTAVTTSFCRRCGHCNNSTTYPPLHRQCSHKNAAAMETIINGAAGSGRWKLLKKVGINPSQHQNKRSFKTALSMILAAVFGIRVLKERAQAYWGAVTVAFIIGNLQGGSWRISSLRLQGTVLGSIYGFLALSASNNHRWAILLLLTPWVIFSTFVRYSPVYGYLGIVSAFTAALVMMGDSDRDITQYAMDRITETFVGIMCFVFVETVVFPERAVVLARNELVSSLINLRDCVAAIVTVYTDQECVHCRSLAVKEIKQLELGLRASFKRQTAFSIEAALEPELWFVPFPKDVYAKLIDIQGRMLDLLFFMVCSLNATTEDVLNEQMQNLLKPLRTSLTALQEEVLSTIDSLQEILQLKIHHGKIDFLKSWFRDRCSSVLVGDIEQPRTGHPDPQHPLLVLGHQNRSVDGVPINLKSTMDNFEHSFEDVFENLKATTNAQENRQLVSNSVILSVSSLTFSLHSLLEETVHLEKGVHELLQAESSWSVLDFWDAHAVHLEPPLAPQE